MRISYWFYPTQFALLFALNLSVYGAAKPPAKVHIVPATVPTLTASTPSETIPVPSDEEIGRAEKMLHELYKDAYQAIGQENRRNAATDLLRQGEETRSDPAARFVLLRDASTIAAGVGDAATVAQSIETMARYYQIDAVSLKVTEFADASKSSFATEAISNLVRACLAAIDQAIVADRYDDAGKLNAIADKVAARSRQAELIAEVRQRQKEVEALRVNAEQFRRAREILLKSPEDPDASLTAGKFLCFVKGDWENGLPLLAAGSDSALKIAATSDLDRPIDPAARVRAGNNWWEMSEKQPGIIQDQLRRRAVYWYRQARPELSGAGLKLIDDRLDKTQADRIRQMNMLPGLLADLYEGQDCNKKKLTRVDPRIDFDWGLGAAAENMPKDNFSIVWSGKLNIPESGQYTFIVIANSGAKLTIDGVTLLDNGQLLHKRNGERISIKIDQGLHSFQLKFWDGGGLAKMRLHWITPYGKQEEAIPPEMFYHQNVH